MNIKEYRESKINKYPNRKTGLLMYRHEKLYDIIKTIEDFVSLSISKTPDIKEYENFLDNLYKKLPIEYKNTQSRKYERFLRDYEETQKELKESKDIKIQIENVKNILRLSQRHNNKIGATIIKHEDLWPRAEMGKYQKGSSIITINTNKEIQKKIEEYAKKHQKKKEEIIYQLLKKHEYHHYLNYIWLLSHNKKFPNLNALPRISQKELISNLIKDEYIAQIVSHWSETKSINDIASKTLQEYLSDDFILISNNEDEKTILEEYWKKNNYKYE